MNEGNKLKLGGKNKKMNTSVNLTTQGKVKEGGRKGREGEGKRMEGKRGEGGR
eukprot:XP_011670559.1 PREDICTED: uncharacterized protein LOC105441277 [Strongylocentrotus purpuratus]